jgi:hypothetical protein
VTFDDIHRLNASIISNLQHQFHVTRDACLSRQWRIEWIGQFSQDHTALRALGPFWARDLTK